MERAKVNIAPAHGSWSVLPGMGVTTTLIATEVFMEVDDVHKTLRRFEDGLKHDHAAITPSMIYAYAALMSGVPFGNSAESLETTSRPCSN